MLAGCSGRQDTGDGSGTSRDLTGRLVFVRGYPNGGASSVYTLDLADRQPHKLFGRGANLPHWSPDGAAISVFCCDDGMTAHLIKWPSRRFHELAPADPTLETHCGQWSSNGERLACESFGVEDPSRNGIYTVRVSDGRGLQRVTANPRGDDVPGDYSPDGRRMVFVRESPTGGRAIYVAELGARTAVRPISPPRLVVQELFGGAWSPNGNAVLFAAAASLGSLPSIWIGDVTSGRVQQLTIPGCGGKAAGAKAAGCLDPAWSPDGTKIVFTRKSPTGSDLYIATRNGGNVRQVTSTGDASQPDWHS